MKNNNEEDFLTKVRLSKPFFYPRSGMFDHPYCIFGITRSMLYENYEYFVENETENWSRENTDDRLVYIHAKLYETIFNFNMENMCKMLFHDNDNLVSVDSSFFIYAIRLNNFEAARILYDYYDEFPFETFKVALHALLNVHEPQDEAVCAQLFKDVWIKSDHSYLVSDYLSFLHTFLCMCIYTNVDWLECFYKIMESPCAIDLVLHYADTVATSFGYLQHIFCIFTNRDLAISDRLSILNLLLSFGMPVNLQDITTAYQLYGYNQEVLALIYSTSMSILTNQFELNATSFALPCAIVGLDFKYDKSAAFEMHCNQILYSSDIKTGDNTAKLFLCKSLRHFSFFSNTKQELLEIMRENWRRSVIEEKLLESPNFPSLLELCRKPARIFLKLKFLTKKPYQFHDAVRNLDLPDTVKDIILYKRPLH